MLDVGRLQDIQDQLHALANRVLIDEPGIAMQRFKDGSGDHVLREHLDGILLGYTLVQVIA